METKALLYLLCEDGANGNIIGFAIDFFNDVTGMDRNALRLYDIQSKGTDSGPSALGQELVTLVDFQSQRNSLNGPRVSAASATRK